MELPALSGFEKKGDSDSIYSKRAFNFSGRQNSYLKFQSGIVTNQSSNMVSPSISGRYCTNKKSSVIDSLSAMGEKKSLRPVMSLKPLSLLNKD